MFIYPSDKKNKNGKLRLLYECNPMSFIIEKAGGKSITSDTSRVLDIEPKDFHERCPIYLGSSDEIDELITFIKK